MFSKYVSFQEGNHGKKWGHSEGEQPLTSHGMISSKYWRYYTPMFPLLAHDYIVIAGQIILFHQPRCAWNKAISRTKKTPLGFFWSCEVATIWPDTYCNYIHFMLYHVGPVFFTRKIRTKHLHKLKKHMDQPKASPCWKVPLKEKTKHPPGDSRWSDLLWDGEWVKTWPPNSMAIFLRDLQLSRGSKGHGLNHLVYMIYTYRTPNDHIFGRPI